MYSDQDIANLVARVQQLEIQSATRGAAGVPDIKLLSRNFLTRAFAVWGHFFVANLLISLVIGCVIGVFSLIVGASLSSWISNLLSSFKGY